MLRRRAGGLYGHSNTTLFHQLQLFPRRHGLLDSFGKFTRGIGTDQAGERKPHRGDHSSDSLNSGLPPGFSKEKLRALQDLFNSQTPEKQNQLMNQVLEFQKTMGKVPGFRKIAEHGVQTMEALLKQQPVDGKGSVPSAGVLPTSGSANSGQGQSITHAASQRRGSTLKPSPAASSGSGGLTLDELKKVNLGPEIEALFDELRTIRAKKNHYRELYNKTKGMLESMSKEKDELALSVDRIHARLKRAEHEVTLLNSECMDAKEAASQVKSLTAQNHHLLEKLKTKEACTTSPGSPSYADLERRLRAKEEALLSLQRKVERMRRRDPLLGFSMVCSDVARFCNPEHDPLKGAADEAFESLQASYLKQQQEVWAMAAGSGNGSAAAKAYVAVVKRFFISRLPCPNYDAVLTVEGDVQALKEAMHHLGFVMTPMADKEGRWLLTASADAPPLTTSLGPYAYAFALWSLSSSRNNDARASSSSSSSNNNGSSSNADNGSPVVGASTGGGCGPTSLPFPALPYSVKQVVPHVSTTLVANPKRVSIVYETARASGPGGQATNVTETQIHAKLWVDGVVAFGAQAQDSRSALQNKESATAKLTTLRRQQHNETLSKQRRAEVVEKEVLAVMAGVGVGTLATAAAEAAAAGSMREAMESGSIPSADVALVRCFWTLKTKLTEGSETFG